MSDVSGAAPAAADSPSVSEAPIGEGANFTQPLGSQVPPEAQAQEPKAPPSLDDSIDRAIEKSAKATKEPPVKEPAKEAKVEPKEAKPEQPRENGKFVAKEADKAPDAKPVKEAPKVEAAKPSHTAGDPPARFTETAKAKWAEADPEIRGEVSRMERELTDGYKKHKEAAERDSTLAEYHEMAKQSGKDLRTVVGEYVNMENALRKDLVGGLDNICQRLGVSLKDVAAHIMGQTPEQNASAQDATIRELKAELASVKQQVGTVAQTFQQQQQTATAKEVEAFAAQNPRFDELAEDIAFFLKTRTNDLSEAYSLAERLNPAPAQQVSTPAASSAPLDPPAQPDKGSKSINGAPSAGASPGKRRVALSLDDALDRAFGQAG